MGRRIVQNKSRMPVGAGAMAEGQNGDLGPYWDRLKNLIPTEVSALYVAGLGIIPQGQKIGPVVWAVLCLIFTVIFIATQTKKAEGDTKKTYPIDWAHVVISSISFILWVYALGGPFSLYGLYIPWIGTLLILAWTFIVPRFYKGTAS